jgi:hypothetical protein
VAADALAGCQLPRILAIIFSLFAKYKRTLIRITGREKS